jgi:hypothetical protein
MLNIQETCLKQSLDTAYQRLIAESTVEIGVGRSVEIIKAGSEAISPYFQHRLVAAIAVLVWTAMTWMALFSPFGRDTVNGTVIRCLPQREVELDSRRVNRMRLGWTLVLGTGLLSAGAFSKFVRLPLNKSTIVALSVVTFLVVKYKDQFKFGKKTINKIFKRSFL